MFFATVCGTADIERGLSAPLGPTPGFIYSMEWMGRRYKVPSRVRVKSQSANGLKERLIILLLGS